MPAKKCTHACVRGGVLAARVALMAVLLTVMVTMSCNKREPAVFSLAADPTPITRQVGQEFQVNVRTSYEYEEVSQITIVIDMSGAPFLSVPEESDIMPGEYTESYNYVTSTPRLDYTFHHTYQDQSRSTYGPAIQAVAFTCESEGEGRLTFTATFEAEPVPPEQMAYVDVTCTADDPPPPDCIEDAIDDLVDSILTGTVTFTDDVIDLICYLVVIGDLTPEEAADLFNESVYECGTSAGGMRVVCPTGVLDMPSGELVTVTQQMAAPIPDADTGHSFIYSAVFDSDGEVPNNWVFVPPYDGDYFRGADRWYQLIYDHMSSTWSVTVTQVDASQSTSASPSAVRAVIEGDTITWFIPRSELPADPLGYRVTSFGHDGMYSATDRGGDVSGTDASEPLSTVP